MTELEDPGIGDHPPPYMIFVVVFLFFITGLLGFLICHLLKKKGYRCRTGDMDDEEEEEVEKLGVEADDDDEENQDTVEQILKCIIENEANMEAFNEMLGGQNVCVRHDPRLRKESIGGIPPHHHTVHSGTDHNSCHLCAHLRTKKGRRHSRTPRSKQRPGEQTVFSVGRFRVTHHDKKLQGGPNPLVGSGDQLDRSLDSEERKESGYNLRSMFKDVRPPLESSNGIAPNVGKRRKSVTIFGLRRGSDPVAVRAREGTGKETGGVRFAIQKQPVVLEELLQTENTEVNPERGTKPGVKPETEPSKSQTLTSPQSEAKTLESQRPAPEDGSVSQSGKPSTGSTAASAPRSLPIPSPASSVQTFRTVERDDTKDKFLENKEAYDPGPLQTSTPIAPIYGAMPGFAPVILSDQPEPYSATGFPVTQTPPDPTSSPDLDPGFGANLALISLGSSPPSSIQIKTPSSVSSLKTPTSPLAFTPSPKLSSRSTPSEVRKMDFSPVLTPSPKLPPSQLVSGRSPNQASGSSPLQARTPSPALTASPKLDSKSESKTSVTSMTKEGMLASPLSQKVQELEGSRIQQTEEKTEKKRPGILKTAKLSPPEGELKVSALSSPADQLPKDRLSSLPLSPFTLSPTSPTGSKMSNVTIVKASPESKRVFSVVTMVEEEKSSTSGDTSELGVQSEKAGYSPAVSQERMVSILEVEQPGSQHGEASGAVDILTVVQEKDDMVQMEDIRDCKVTQVEEAGGDGGDGEHLH